jgi:hypothetical protein
VLDAVLSANEQVNGGDLTAGRAISGSGENDWLRPNEFSVFRDAVLGHHSEARTSAPRPVDKCRKLKPALILLGACSAAQSTAFINQL